MVALHRSLPGILRVGTSWTECVSTENAHGSDVERGGSCEKDCFVIIGRVDDGSLALDLHSAYSGMVSAHAGAFQ